jgi:hypothetical protein
MQKQPQLSLSPLACLSKLPVHNQHLPDPQGMQTMPVPLQLCPSRQHFLKAGMPRLCVCLSVCGQNCRSHGPIAGPVGASAPDASHDRQYVGKHTNPKPKVTMLHTAQLRI